MAYTEVVKKIYRLRLDALALYRFCQTDTMKRAYEIATDVQKTEISKLVAEVNVKALKSLISKIAFDYVDTLNFVELRVIAKRNFVAHYSRMDKDQLKQAVKELKGEFLFSTSGKRTEQNSSIPAKSGPG